MTFRPANFDPSIDPTADQVRALRDAGPDGPVVMLNLLKFREQANYPAASPHAPCSGAEAYCRYQTAFVETVGDVSRAEVVWADRQTLHRRRQPGLGQVPVGPLSEPPALPRDDGQRRVSRGASPIATRASSSPSSCRCRADESACGRRGGPEPRGWTGCPGGRDLPSRCGVPSVDQGRGDRRAVPWGCFPRHLKVRNGSFCDRRRSGSERKNSTVADRPIPLKNSMFGRGSAACDRRSRVSVTDWRLSRK